MRQPALLSKALPRQDHEGVGPRPLAREATVHVDPGPALQPPVKVGALLGEEAGHLDVALPVLEVGLPVGDVEVAGDEDQVIGRGTPLHASSHGVQEGLLSRPGARYRLRRCGSRPRPPSRRRRGGEVDLDPSTLLDEEVVDADPMPGVEAEDIGLLTEEPRESRATDGRPNAADVGRDDAHAGRCAGMRRQRMPRTVSA